VHYERLGGTILTHGDLESAENSDIRCRVKANTPNSTVATTIKWVIDEGTLVKGPRPGYPNGDLLVELDDSGLQDLLKTETIALDKAESDKIQAEEAYKIQVSQNESDIKTAETKREIAAIALSKYTGLNEEEIRKPATVVRLKREVVQAGAGLRRPTRELAEEDLRRYKTGDYLALLKDALGQIDTAQSDLSQQEDREAWALRMVKKGYQTPSQSQAETSRKEALQLTLNKQTLALDVLVKYTKVSDLTQKITDLEEAQRALDRARAQAKAKEAQAAIDRDAKRSVWELEQTRCKDYGAEIKKCKIYAPHDGRVLYYVPEQVRRGGGGQQAIVAQGEPVREEQVLLQLPDLGHMVVDTRIHEAQVPRVHPGQPAQVRLEAFPGRVLRGRVLSISTLAAPRDWRSADVNLYVTKVAIDPEDAADLDLKPAMSAEVAIDCEDAVKPVLTVPVKAIVRDGEVGAERKIFVMTPDGPEEREVTVAGSDGKRAGVKNGLDEGDEVVVNPDALQVPVGQP
jgi:multidrug resistance efflux pump